MEAGRESPRRSKAAPELRGDKGTDPATLSRTEEQRIERQTARSGNPQAGLRRQDWKQ